MIISFILSALCNYTCLDALQSPGRQYTLEACLQFSEPRCAEAPSGYFYGDWRPLKFGAWVAEDLPNSWAVSEIRKQIVYRDLIPGC